jgi:predicted ATP-dependent endonuclease of OLD family
MLKKIAISKFTAFESATLEFSRGVNVFLGANATGKTHVMKLAYSIIRAWRDLEKEGYQDARRSNAVLGVLSIYPGFIAAYQNRELAFDETYYDACLALSAAPLRGPRGETGSALWQPLGEHLHANVSFEQERFYLVTRDDGIIEAHLAAEGYRKIATVMHLIANGSLMKNAILFRDEPEANLNPRLTKIVSDFLLRLASNGVQVFVASHDYVLTNELSLNAE